MAECAGHSSGNDMQPFFILHTRNPSATSRKRKRAAGFSGTADWHDDDHLRLDAFRRTWSTIHSTIHETLRSLNAGLFHGVLHWAKGSFAAVRRTLADPLVAGAVDRPYPLLLDPLLSKIPAALILTKNAEFVDDVQTFLDLGVHLRSNGCHVVHLSVLDFASKQGVVCCLRSLVRQLIPEATDRCDMSALVAWHQEPENCEQPVVVIIEGVERCCGVVLSELIFLISEWAIKLPIFLAMEMATSFDSLRKLISPDSLLKLQPCKLVLGSPIERMNALVEAVLVKPCTEFCIGHSVAVFMRNFFFRHDGTITSFIRALKFACSSHFFTEPLSVMSQGMDRSNYEDLLQTMLALPRHFIDHAVELPSCKSAKLLNKDAKDIAQELYQLSWIHKNWRSVLLCLFEIGRRSKIQLLDIFCEAMDPNFDKEIVFSGSISAGKGSFVGQAINMLRDMQVTTLSDVLKMWSIYLQEIEEVHENLNALKAIAESAPSVVSFGDKCADNRG